MTIHVETSYEEYGFPSLDFKFINHGLSSGAINKLRIFVREIKVNVSPDLRIDIDLCKSFWREYDRAATGLEIIVSNDGWGDLVDGKFSISGGLLSELFQPEVLSFAGSVESGRSINFMISIEDMNQDSFQKVVNKSKLNSTKTEGMYWPASDYKREMHSANLREVFIDAKYYSILMDKLYKKRLAYEDTWSGSYKIEKDCFVFEDNRVAACMGMADTRYACIIDVDEAIKKPNYDKIYRISRNIKAGELDHFQIMVGATKSCEMRLQFEFLDDRGSKIMSPEFVIEVLNSRRQMLHRCYSDGVATLIRDKRFM